jgi:hypothetical protein
MEQCDSSGNLSTRSLQIEDNNPPEWFYEVARIVGEMNKTVEARAIAIRLKRRLRE